MIQSYKQKLELEEHYDAIIIGSGIGTRRSKFERPQRSYRGEM